MIGDRLIILPEHKSKCGIILPHACYLLDDACKAPCVICIGGESGTGKTEVATLFQENLWNLYGKRSHLVHLDDYYFTSWHDRDTIREKNGIDSVGISEIDWDSIDKILNALSKKHKYIYTKRIHKYLDGVEESKLPTKNIDILIIEGLYANHIEHKCLGVYLSGSYHQTRKFRENRKKENQTRFRQEVLKKEREEVRKTKEKADLVIPFKIS